MRYVGDRSTTAAERPSVHVEVGRLQHSCRDQLVAGQWQQVNLSCQRSSASSEYQLATRATGCDSWQCLCVVEALVHTRLKSTADDSEVELMQSNDEAVELMGSEDWQRRPTCRYQSVWQERDFSKHQMTGFG